MTERRKDIVKCLIGLVLITTIIAIPHNLFGIDILSFFSIFSFLLVGLTLFSKWPRIFFILLTVNCALVPLLSLEFFWAKMEFCPELWGAIFDTTRREVSELVGKSGWWLILSVAIGGTMGWLICSRFLPKKWTGRSALISFIIGLIGIICTTWYNTEKVEGGFVYFGFKKLHPINYPVSFLYEIIQSARTSSLDKERNAFQFGIKKKLGSSSERKVVVLAIGETSRGDHWSINGYGRKTSPYADTNAHLYSYKNMVAPASMTILSLPLIMTAVGPYQRMEHYRQKGLIDAFKEAGFYTIWFTNQDESFWDKSKVKEFHIENVDSLANMASEHGLKSYDSKLVVSMEEILKANYNRNVFLVLHLNGSHFRYTERYPKAFNMFNKNSPHVAKNQNGYDQEIAEYDNTILYSDYVLNMIIDKLREVKGDVSLIYVSDHGENLKDDSRQLMYHSPEPTKYNLNIAYFLWMNDQMHMNYPNYDSILRDHMQYPLLSSEATFYTALDFAGLEWPNKIKVQESQSLLSTGLKYSQQPFYSPLSRKLTYSDLLKN